MKPLSLSDNARFIRIKNIVINLNQVLSVERTEHHNGAVVTAILMSDGKPFKFSGEEGEYIWKFWEANSIDIEKDQSS